MISNPDQVLLTAINQSQLKTWRQCQQRWEYRYGQRLIPKQKERALTIGTWVHACLETHYRDGDWRIGFNQYLAEYNSLFEEERLALDRGRRRTGVGTPLPDIIKRIIRSYFYYYKADGWTVHSVEQVFDVTFKGIRFKGRIDLIIKDAEGLLWLVDHKTGASIPQNPNTFHAMDPQLILYPWAAKRMWGLELNGIIYNYVKSKPPTLPQLTKTGKFSRRKINTDYPTYYRFLKENDFDPRDFTDTLLPLKKRSDFLRRYRLPRETAVVRRILQEGIWTAREILDHSYTTRNITRDCDRCPYQAVCRADLNGHDSSPIKRANFTIEEGSYLDDGDTDGTEPEEEDTEN